MLCQGSPIGQWNICQGLGASVHLQSYSVSPHPASLPSCNCFLAICSSVPAQWLLSASARVETWVQHSEGGGQTCTFCPTLSQIRALGTCEGLNLCHNFPHAWANVILNSKSKSPWQLRERETTEERKTFSSFLNRGLHFYFALDSINYIASHNVL